MGKKLIIVRHAEAESRGIRQDDLNRMLSVKGYNDASKMGRRLKEAGFVPDSIFCSHAERARTTAELIAAQIDFDAAEVVVDEELYEASARTLLSFVNEINDELEKVMLVGHNPAVSYFAEYLSEKDIGDVVPCGILEIDFSIDSWGEVAAGIGELKYYIYPEA